MIILKFPLQVLLVFRCLLKKADRPDELSTGLDDVLFGSLLLNAIMSLLSFFTGFIETGFEGGAAGVAGGPPPKNCSKSSAVLLDATRLFSTTASWLLLSLSSVVKMPKGSAVELVSDIVGLLADMSVSVTLLFGSDWFELRLFELQYDLDCKPR